MKEKFNKITNENKILIMLAFFSISTGLWGNFRQLWLQSNNFAVNQISIILSFANFICAFGILIFAKSITLDKLGKFISFALIIKAINMLSLFLYNGYNVTNLIKMLIISDIILEKLIIISIYPFIVTIRKNDKLYSKRKLVEYLFRDMGVLIGGLFVGKMIFGIYANYNIFLLISVIFLAISFFIISTITINKRKKTNENKINIKNIIKYIINDKILTLYLLCYFFGNIAINTGLGLKMLMLTNIFNFSDSNATNYLLIIGITADILGIVALKYLTPKNDYLTITIKFFIRFATYTIAFLSNNNILTFIAITWSILISTAYENVTDAPYVNRLSSENQLFFNDIRFIVGVIGESIGLFFAGIMYNYGASYMLGLSAFFMIFQIALSYRLIYLRQNKIEKVNKIDNSIQLELENESI